MNIHEHQAKTLLRDYGVNVPDGFPAQAWTKRLLQPKSWQVQSRLAQIHAGGRGKAGGVKAVKTLDEVRAEAGRLLGSVLVTHRPPGRQRSSAFVY